MLDDLDAVPWQSLRHALGNASNVPRLLRALAASDHEERQSALKELFACLLHQGSVNEATAPAVPFLFQLLASDGTPERNWIAFLIASLGDGKGYLNSHTSSDEQRWREILAQRGTTLEAELQKEEEIVQAVEREVGRSVELLLPYLNDTQSEIRAAVARALGRQNRNVRPLILALQAAEQRETATDARDAIRLGLAKLNRATPT